MNTPTRTGTNCQACGHPFTEDDPVMVLEGGTRIHVSHSRDPRSGFYGARAACDCGAATATPPRPHSLDCAIHFPVWLGEEDQEEDDGDPTPEALEWARKPVGCRTGLCEHADRDEPCP